MLMKFFEFIENSSRLEHQSEAPCDMGSTPTAV